MKVRLTAAVLALSALPLNAAWSADPNTKVTLDLDRQPLEAALVELSKQGHLQLVIATGSLPATIAEPLHGSMSLGLALDRLLRNTGLTYKLVGDHTIAIVKSAEPRQASDPPTLPGASGEPGSDASSIDDRKVDRGAQDTNEARGERSVNHRSMMLRLASFLGLCVTGVASYPACAADDSPGAQGQLEEVVVTAERRSADIQKAATSVSVRSGAELRNQGRYTLRQMLEDVPGISGGAADAPVQSASGVDSAAPGLNIRGLKSNSGAFGSVTSVAAAAAVYVDGVYEGVGGGYDIDRVEILRGPQGTLYGRSATSGLVAIHTKDPQLDRLGGDATLELGNFNLRHYTGAVNVPVVANALGIRVSGNRYERNGYVSADGGALASTDAKVKILYKPNDDVSLLLGFALQNNDTHNGGTTITLKPGAPNTFCFESPSTCAPTPVGTGSNDFRQYWALLNWNLGFATLTYQPAYRTWKSQGVSYSRSNAPGPAANIDSTVEFPRDRFNTQEIRLSSHPDSKLIWQIGGLYYENSLSSGFKATFVPSGIVPVNAQVRDKTTRAAGVFAEATYPVADAWRVTAGARYDHTRVSIVEDYTSITGVTQNLSGEAGTRRFDNVTYKARLEHDLTAQNMLYASVSTGFSPGDVSVTTGPSGNPYALDLEAETLTAYEVGSKNRFLDNRLQVNGAIYYSHYGAYQTAGINVAPALLNSLVFATLAAPAQIYGGELETLMQLTPSDRAGLNLGYTKAHFVDKNRVINTGAGSTVKFSEYFVRDEIPGITPFTASLSYDHTFHLPADSTLTFRGAARYLAGHPVTNVTAPQRAAGTEPYLLVDAQVVGDLSATWASASDRFSVTGYVRNVDDKQFKVSAFAQTGSVTSSPSDPRTYGAVLNVNF